MANYEQRLLKFVKAHSGFFSSDDIAAMWKRNKWDVGLSTLHLIDQKQLKLKCGVLHAA